MRPSDSRGNTNTGSSYEEGWHRGGRGRVRGWNTGLGRHALPW